MAVRKAHLGGLADDRDGRPSHMAEQVVDQAGDAETAGFLVVGQGDMDRLSQRMLEPTGDRGERCGDEALHVGRPSAEQPVVPLGQGEGIARPGLAVDRNDVAMSGENDAALAIGAEARQQIGLGAGIVVGQADACAVGLQIVGGPV